MATNTVYSLAFTPGVANGAVVANYTLNFGLYTPYVFWNRGSNNGVDAEGLSLYVNNKQNNNIVTVNADNGQYIRDIPPYGEAVLPIGGRQIVSISSNGGVCPIEFHNRPANERIFQRTDSASQIVQFSGTLGTTFGDLLTIDRIGRLQTADAQPFTANNTTVDIQTGTAWPARPAQVNFTAASYSIQDAEGRVACMDNATGAQLALWISNNAGVNIAALHSVAGACVPQPINEGPAHYYTAWQNQNACVVARKSDGVVIATQSPPGAGTGYLCCTPKAGGGVTDYWVVYNTANFFEIANFTNNVWQGTVTTMITGGSYNTSTDTIFACAFGSNLLIAFWDSGTNRLEMCVVNPLTGGSTLGSLSVLCASNLGFKGKNWINVAINSSGYGFLPYRNSTTGTVHLAVISPSGPITSNNLGSGGTLAFGSLTSDGGYIVCWTNGLTLNARKYDATGAFVNAATYTLAAGAWNGIVPLPLNETQNAFLLCYNNGGFLRAIVINSELLELVPIASPLLSNLAIAAGHWPVYASANDFALVNPSASPPVVAQGELAKSVFGVDRGDGAVLIQGVGSINQFFAGSNTFNQNAATVVGNRGIVVNSTVQLNGLT